MYYTNETKKKKLKKEKIFFERGSRLCQKIEVVVVSDLAMIVAG
jgi:hypothetical protein